MVWNKLAHNFGHYVSVRHENLLICTRGSCTPDRPTPRPESVVSERRSAIHSEKPGSFRQTIERLYPLGARLELFGRHEVAGWTVYGNQLRAPASDTTTLARVPPSLRGMMAVHPERGAATSFDTEGQEL